MASVFSSLFKGKKSNKSTQEPSQVDKTSNESVKQELRELSYEEGDSSLKPKTGLMDKLQVNLGIKSELHGSKAGSKKSGDKLQGLMSSSHAKRAVEIAKLLSFNSAGNNIFHALTVQMMGGDMGKLAEAYKAVSDDNETLSAGLIRVFSGYPHKLSYLESILEHGEPDLVNRLTLASGEVTGVKASQTAMMKLVEDADPTELEQILNHRGADKFFDGMKDSAKEWLGIFKGKGKRILAAVKGRKAEMALDKAIKEHGANSDEASDAFKEVVKSKSEHLCEIYHQRWSALSGLARKAMADDLERICSKWDPKVREAAVAPDQPFHQLLVKEMASLQVLIRTGAGTAGYLLNIAAGKAKPANEWFVKEEKVTKQEEKKEKKQEKSESKDDGRLSSPTLGEEKKLAFELEKDPSEEKVTLDDIDAEEVETEGDVESDSEDLPGGKEGKETSEVVPDKADNDMVGSGPMAVLRELEYKKGSKTGIKHLKAGLFMKWKTLEDKVSALDDHQRLEILVSFLTEDERMEMFDPELKPYEVMMLRDRALGRFRDKLLVPAGMTGSTLVRFIGAFQVGASKDGHRSSSPYGRLRSLVSAKLKPLAFSRRAFFLVSKLAGGEIYEVAHDKELMRGIEARCDSSLWVQICLILNVGADGEVADEKLENKEGRESDIEKRDDLTLDGQEARQHAADMAELRPEFWAMKLGHTIEGGLAAGGRHDAVVIMNGALRAAVRRETLTRTGEGPKGLTPLSKVDFCNAVVKATSKYSMKDLKKDEILGPAIAKFEQGVALSPVEQLRVGWVDQPYAKGDDFLMIGKQSRMLELVHQAKGKELLQKWSNYGEWYKMRVALQDLKRKPQSKERDLEAKTLQNKLDTFTLDVNAEVQDETWLVMTTTRRVQFLDAVRNRLADAMENDEEFRDSALNEFDMGRFSQEKTRSLGALDSQKLEDSTAQWDKLSGSDVRKESRDMLIGRIRTGHETLSTGKKEGQSQQSKEQVDTKQSDKVSQTRTELRERTTDFVQVRNMANAATMAVVGAVVGALATAIATGVTAATFGGATPVWAAMLFAAGAAVGSSAVTLALEKALKGDQFNATEALAQAAMKVVVATATAGTGPLAEMLGGSLAGMKDLGSLVAMSAIKAAIRSAVKRGLQAPMQFAQSEQKDLPWHLLGHLGGFVGDLAGGVVQTATSGGLSEVSGLTRFKGEGGEVVDHLGKGAEELTTLQKVGKGGLSALGAVFKQVPPLAITGGTKATRAVYDKLYDHFEKESITQTDKTTGDTKDDGRRVVGWRSTVRLMGVGAGKKADEAKKKARSDKDKKGADALAEKADALAAIAQIAAAGVGEVMDSKLLEEVYLLIAEACIEVEKAMAAFDKVESGSEKELEKLEGKESDTTSKDRVDGDEKAIEKTETLKVEVKL